MNKINYLTSGTEVYSPSRKDSQNNFSMKVLLDDKIEIFSNPFGPNNANSNNPSILTEHADNMQTNI